MSGNKIASINPYTFYKNLNLVWLDLGRNSIDCIHPSTLAKASKLTE